MEITSQITCFDIVSLTIQAIAAFATVFAVCVSLHDSRQAKRIHDEDLKKDQATKVSCWFEETESCEPAPQDDSHVWQNIVLQNESNCPIYNVIVTCVATQGAGPHSKGEDNDPEVPRPSLYWDFTSRPLVPMAPHWRQRNAYHARTGSSLHRCAGDIVGQARQRQLGDNQGFAFASSFLQNC